MRQACTDCTASVNVSVVHEVQIVSSTGIVIEAALLAILTLAIAFVLIVRVSSVSLYHVLEHGY